MKDKMKIKVPIWIRYGDGKKWGKLKTAAKTMIKTSAACKLLLLFRYANTQKALRTNQDNGDKDNQRDDVGDFG